MPGAANDAVDPVKLALARSRAVLFGIPYPVPCPNMDEHGLLPQAQACEFCHGDPEAIVKGHPAELAALQAAIPNAERDHRARR